MIIERLFPETTTELRDIISPVARDSKAVAFQAGHFLLYYDHTEDLLMPCVATELTAPRFSYVTEAIGNFPLLTWELAIQLINELSAIKKGFLTIVNDWQYLPKGVDRSAFYRQTPKLFSAYQASLSEFPEIKLVTPASLGMKTPTGVWFSEISLRNQFNRRVSRLIKSGKIVDNCIVERQEEGLTCSLVDALGKKQQIYCAGKRGTCTHELAELNCQILGEGNFDLLINLYPLVCREYVQQGTDWACDLFSVNGKVVNVGFPSSFVTDEISLFSECEVTIHGRE